MDVELLTSSRLFGGISASILAPLAEAFVPRTLPPDGAAAVQGDPADALLVVTAGTFETVARDVEDGLEYTGPDLAPGDDFGLEAALLGRTHTATLRARGDARIEALDRAALVLLTEEEPLLGTRVSTVLAERLHSAAAQGRASVVDLARVRCDERLWALLPRHAIVRYRALPLAQNGGVLVVGFVDPTDIAALDDVRRLAQGHRVRPVALDAVGFDRFYRGRVAPVLDRWRPEESDGDRWFLALKQKSYDLKVVEGITETVSIEERGRQVSGEAVINLMNRLIGEALELSASDIHIEPSETELVVRFRVDGRLKKRPEPLEMRFHGPLVSRIKVLGRMDIAEKRRAQDGRLSIAWGSREVDFRLSTVPTRFGEKIVLRILDPASVLIDLERLVPRERTYRAIRWMIDQPQGMVLVAGPTGSGKTTTIYSALLRLREDEVNIVTIEDPIEYTIGGITQVQVNELAGITFANSVRAFLRQDPDIILVGETRDPQTAATSIEAALTGHLVITSVHANDALGVLVRLREMGIEPFLLANTVIGVVSQRLVRRVCAACRTPVSYHPDLIRPLGLFPDDETVRASTFYRGAGCIHCNFQGFRGRAGVFEVLRIDERLRPLVAAGLPIDEIERVALEAGLLLPLRDYCRDLLVSGVTTPEEVTRVLFTD